MDVHAPRALHGRPVHTPSPTSNQVSTFSRSAMLFRASDPSVASLETPMVSVIEWFNTAMKGVTPVNK